PGITAEEFVQQIDSANLLDNKNKPIDKLLQAMGKTNSPWISIGFDGCILYRLVPEAFGLQAHPREKATTASGSRPLLPRCFLGLNSTVQPHEPAVPANRRQANLSEISACSAESDDADAPGFAFFQLGELQYARRQNGREGWPENDDVERAEFLSWRPTGFNLVARLGPSGARAGGHGIYAIYDMFPRGDDDYDDYLDRLRRRRTTHPFWGIPPIAKDGNEEEQFSCAKLGDRLSDFGKAHRLVWMDKIEHPVELVRVVRAGDGRVLRATVDESTRVFGGREGRGTETGSED
ncbi:hypothetical protein C8A01DRAFT_19752, partial [Parachaetomium inaequale]